MPQTRTPPTACLVRSTLYSLALGCEVAVFEPVPLFQAVMRLGISLNPGFSDRVTIYGNVVYDAPGNYSLRAPVLTRTPPLAPRVQPTRPLRFLAEGGRRREQNARASLSERSGLLPTGACHGRVAGTRRSSA